jgi:hypothetical protein
MAYISEMQYFDYQELIRNLNRELYEVMCKKNHL